MDPKNARYQSMNIATPVFCRERPVLSCNILVSSQIVAICTRMRKARTFNASKRRNDAGLLC
jgi:hypothetical protein